MEPCKLKLVVVGNGMAGIRCVEEILKNDAERYEITVIGQERHPNYNRIMLSKVLQGSASFDDIVLNPYEWYREHHIKLHTGERAARIHTGEERKVEMASGLTVPWDRLILAAGSSAFVPPIPGVDKKGVISFRNLEDCSSMIRASQTGRRAVVIGGGLLGLEAARGLLNLGMETEVVHNASFLMNRQLDAISAGMLKSELEHQGMTFRLNAVTESITGVGRARGLLFADGNRTSADLVVLAVGIKPNTDLAAASGIHVNRGILVDDALQTNVPGIYAIGECAEHRGITYGLVAPLYEQAKLLARRLCSLPTEPYRGSTVYAQLKVSGVDVFSAGEIREDEVQVAQRSEDGIRGVYRKVTLREGRIAGAILYGDTAESAALLKLIRQGAFAGALSSEPGGSSRNGAQEAAAALPAEDKVCACNEVSKAAIMQAVIDGGASTADEVKRATGASGSCGGCRPMVAALVEYAKSGGLRSSAASAEPERQPAEERVCGCLPFGHAGLKAAAESAARHLSSAVRMAAEESVLLRELQPLPGEEWSGGCRTCRPAVLYYVRDRFQAAGQPNGEAFGRSGREVSVHVAGPEYANGRKDEARSIGSRWLRRWNMAALPGPVDTAVSAGPAYPAGVLVHGIGLRRCPAGWELYAGGHSEQPVREGQLIGIADHAEEAAALGEALLQLYREEAYYAEALWEWLDRTGIRSIREALLDPEIRTQLLDRFARETQAVSVLP